MVDGLLPSLNSDHRLKYMRLQGCYAFWLVRHRCGGNGRFVGAGIINSSGGYKEGPETASYYGILEHSDLAGSQGHLYTGEKKKALVARELNKYGIDIAALSETRLADHGKLREAIAGYNFYGIGNLEEERRKHGVGFAIADRLTSVMVSEPNGVRPRLISLRLKLEHGGFDSVFSAYASTMQYTEEDEGQIIRGAGLGTSRNT